MSSIGRLCLTPGCGRRFPRSSGGSYCPRCRRLRKTRRNSDRKVARAVVEGAEVCVLCGVGPRPGDPFTLEHRTPVSAGGTSRPGNVGPAHRSCNSAKRDGR